MELATPWSLSHLRFGGCSSQVVLDKTQDRGLVGDGVIQTTLARVYGEITRGGDAEHICTALGM